MKKYLVAKKQDSGEMVYISSIASLKVGETLNCWEALDFHDKDVAVNICSFLNGNFKTSRYVCVLLEYSITETSSGK